MSLRVRNTLSLAIGHASAWLMYGLICGGLTRFNGAALTLLVIVPAGTAWAGATLFDTWRPRTLLNAAPRALACNILGLLGGSLAAAGVTGLVWVIDRPLIQASTLVWGPACITVLLSWVSSRRLRPGRCVACGYDIRGSLSGGVCPECGRDLRREINSVRISATTHDHGKISPIRV